MVNIRKFLAGIGLIPVSSTTIDTKGEMEVLSTGGKLNYHNGTTASPMVTEAHSATLTNKSIDADTNTITNIENADIKAAAAIDAAKIHDGTVSNTEFGYLNGVSSAIQTQLDNITAGTTPVTLTDAHIFVGNASNDATDVAVSGDISISNTGVVAISSGVIVNADVNASAAIDRTKLASGTADHVIINNGTGVLSSEAQLATSRGGTGVNSTATFPTSGVVVTEAGTQTLTNKTLTAPVIATIVNTGTLTLPTSTDTLVGRATTDTLTNKTLTAPIISTISNTGTLTLPTSTDTLVGRDTTDTLTNKTLTSPTIAKIGNLTTNGFVKTSGGDGTLGVQTSPIPAADLNLGRTINAQTGTTYTFVLSDGSAAGGNTLVTASNASAQTYTVPPNSSVAFPVGTQIDVAQLGAGKVTLAQGSGVTINSKSSNKAIGAQYVGVTLVKTGTDTWLLLGDLIA